MKNLLLSSIIAFIFYSCSFQNKEKTALADVPFLLSDTLENACCPYLTQNAEGEIFMVFTAESKEQRNRGHEHDGHAMHVDDNISKVLDKQGNYVKVVTNHLKCNAPDDERKLITSSSALKSASAKLGNGSLQFSFAGKEKKETRVLSGLSDIKDYPEKNIKLQSYVYLSKWDEKEHRFMTPVRIEQTKGAALHPESMAKVAFKANGNIILAFEIKKRTEKHPYAGEIHYIESVDNGKSWTEPQLLHADATEGKGRSFFDIATLPNGEVGACWLDASNPDGGRPVKFAQTSSGKGFANELVIDNLACECCRTALKVDQSGKINVIYRNIEVLNKEEHIRDMAIVTSIDGGKSFSEPVIVNNDNWKLVGCPHMGPALSMTENKRHVAWFTAGGEPGIYYTSSPLDEERFETRKLISREGKNPQMWAMDDLYTFIVYAEPVGNNDIVAEESHSGHSHQSVSESKPFSLNVTNYGIKLREETGSGIQTTEITSPESNASFPVIIGNKKDGYVIISWVEEAEGNKVVKYMIKKRGEAIK